MVPPLLATEVAWFEPEDGGSHNVWVAGDTLIYRDGLTYVPDIHSGL